MTSNGGASYSYDAESRLATTAGVTYTYDGDGNRVKKPSGTLYWGAGPMLESDLSGGIMRGVTGDNGFTATQIGNNPDGSGGLIDKTTGTGSYTATFDGQNVTFTNAQGQQSTGTTNTGTDGSGTISFLLWEQPGSTQRSRNE